VFLARVFGEMKWLWNRYGGDRDPLLGDRGKGQRLLSNSLVLGTRQVQLFGQEEVSVFGEMFFPTLVNNTKELNLYLIRQLISVTPSIGGLPHFPLDVLKPSSNIGMQMKKCTQMI
jgi:hypothetical protein